MQICDILGAVAPYAARIISHTSPWWAAGNNLVIGEDVGKENSQEESEWIIKNDSAIH